MFGFKVPKLKVKECMESVALDSSQYKSEIWFLIDSNFHKPTISKTSMVVSSAWLINNPSAEDSYVKRRQSMRKEIPSISESVGFFFVNSLEKVRELSNLGQIPIGNIKSSHLATSTMGVSLCLFSDIYHPGYDTFPLPNTGYLILVKYLKGRINYVPCDSCPMDPQPQFDCHMTKNPLINDRTVCMNAFHQSQVFIYDYTDEGDIVKFSTKMLISAAVKFTWRGFYLFKMISRRHKPFTSKFTSIQGVQREENKTLRQAELERQIYASSLLIHKNNASSVIRLNLSIKGDSSIEKNACAFLYLTNRSISLLRTDNIWEISAAIEISEFEREFRHLQINWANKPFPKSSKYLMDPLSQDVIISLNRPNLLVPRGAESECLSSNEMALFPRYVTYLRFVVDDYQYSKRLCHLLNLSKTMGVISRPHDPEISILIFPDGKISKILGINKVSTDYYFHGLVFHSQYPNFIVQNNTPETMKEKDIYSSCLAEYKRQNIKNKLKMAKPLISVDDLKETVKSQAEAQKAQLFKLLRPDILEYDLPCFDLHCTDKNCPSSIPSKKTKEIDITNKENVSITGHKKKKKKKLDRKQQHRLSKKLYDYFKRNTTLYGDADTDTISTAKDKECPTSSTTNAIPQSYEIIDISNCHSDQDEVKINESPHGSFRSLQFFENAEARYWGSSGYEIINFPQQQPSQNMGPINSTSSGRNNAWTLNSDQFKKNRDWSGISVYDN